MEDFISGNIDELAQFLNKDLSIRQIPAVNENEVHQNRLPKFEEWPDGDRQAFWRICGETTLRLGYRGVP